MNYYADLASKIEGVYANLPSALGRAYGMVIKADRRVRRDRALQLPAHADGNQGRTGLAAGNTIVVKPPTLPARAARRRADAGGRASSGGAERVAGARARRLARR